MVIPEEDVLVRVSRALSAFFTSEADLLQRYASERSIAHKLAEHLQREFPTRSVDCEYNRHGNAIKRQSARGGDATHRCRAKAGAVLPDIVVHKRGSDEQNVLVVEIKKSVPARSIDRDQEKLRTFTGSEYGYTVGLLLLIDVKNKRIGSVRVFRDGREDEDDPMWGQLRKVGADV